ncbi:RluA family pseudouridine synthase [Allofustis seminis]|uniref:RluA family pseudouridine synthase n=1 Tax=Allofustis seminis TaxID=166939 RepID=UPI00037E70D1|nr:RluA family pseudouridine synthase [Allofustis seminis]
MMYWQVGAEDAKILRDFLKERGVSRRIIGRVKFHGGSFYVNGRKVHTREILEVGDEVKMQLPIEEANEYLYTSPLPISIVFENEHYLIVDKPAGLVTTPSSRYRGDTVAARVKNYLIKKDAPHQIVHTVTRLDRYTSGAVLIAKNMFVHSMLARLLEQNILTREYIAVVKGHLQKKEGTIDAPIGRLDRSIIERVVCENGQPARTSYRVLKELDDISIVAARLHTGRTHQIRVHFKALGHPIVGDDLYDETSPFISRQALHCYYLAFLDPFTSKNFEQITPLPEDMCHLIKQTGGTQWLEEDLRKNKNGFASTL